MIKRFLFIAALLICFIGSVRGQEKQKKAYKPDIPGFFMVDFGFNFSNGRPANFDNGFWGSRTLNLYYHYPIQIGNSKISYNPGAGFAFERFKLTNDYTLPPQPGSDGSYALITPGNFNSTWSINKSMIVANYFDLMPVEFRFDTNPKDMSRSFSVSLGGRVGVLFESHTKIKYSAPGVNGHAIYKDKQEHGLNQFRYSAYTRIGFGNFNLFGYYNFSPYFATGKGPDQTTMTTMTFGISINGL
jgi:hypothetical protein